MSSKCGVQSKRKHKIHDSCICVAGLSERLLWVWGLREIALGLRFKRDCPGLFRGCDGLVLDSLWLSEGHCPVHGTCAGLFPWRPSRHGVPGSADRGRRACPDGARQRPGSHHHLLLMILLLSTHPRPHPYPYPITHFTAPCCQAVCVWMCLCDLIPHPCWLWNSVALKAAQTRRGWCADGLAKCHHLDLFDPRVDLHCADWTDPQPWAGCQNPITGANYTNDTLGGYAF